MVGASQLCYAGASAREEVGRAGDGVGRLDEAARKSAAFSARLGGHVVQLFVWPPTQTK